MVIVLERCLIRIENSNRYTQRDRLLTMLLFSLLHGQDFVLKFSGTYKDGQENMKTVTELFLRRSPTIDDGEGVSGFQLVCTSP